MTPEESIASVLSGERTWTVINAPWQFVLPFMPAGLVAHCITDPPYSEGVHKSVRSAKRNELPDVEEFACRTRRVVDLGFEHINQDEREAVADQIERLTKRWVLIFSDVESCSDWRRAFTSLEYIRTGEWRRIGGAPQFTGDRPASGFEAITIMHPKGRKRWNGGGKAASWECPIVANRLGQRGSRIHPTQKPLLLMLELVEDFTDPGDVILDPFCGSGTTGVAAVRLGRRFIGLEMKQEHAATATERLQAECQGLSLVDARAGQVPLFGS